VNAHREERLLADRERLTALWTASTIFRFESASDADDRYTLSFRGRGLAPQVAVPNAVTVIEVHRIELRLPFAYPESPPDIRWLTPLWHPNVSFSGCVGMTDLGLVWSRQMPIDVVCERLWDIARAAYFDLDHANNIAARDWFAAENRPALPIDQRPLCDRVAAGGSNIVRYQRLRGQGMRLAGAPTSGEIIFIDENTPTPPLPERQPYVPVGLRRDEKDVFYIGPE